MRHSHLTLAVFVSLGLSIAAASAGAPAGAYGHFAAAVDAAHDDLVAVRRDIHRHPDVSGDEERTAGLVADRLRHLGFDVRTGVGGYGVVARLDGARPGPVVAFRADMDAVPSDAPDPIAEIRSEKPGVRHICGHDVHTTVGLGLASGFAAIRDELPGSVVLVFQPAEERATGARAMTADKALDEHAPKAIFAFHTAPFEVGQVAVVPGVQMAWRDRVQVRIRGEGDLKKVADAAREAVLAIGTLAPEQALGPAPDPEFLFVQMLAPVEDEGGWKVEGMVSAASLSASAHARDEIQASLAALEAPGVATELVYDERWIAGVVNDPELTEQASASARRVLGEEAVLPTGGIVPAFSEDFGTFQERTPGVMLFLGVSNTAKGWVGMPHSPGYVADEEAIGIGAKVMGAIILDVLTAGG